MLSVFMRLDDLIESIEKYILMILVSALTLIMMAQVILRYIFNSPLFWAEEVSVQLLVFMTLIGFSVLIKRNGHISIDIVTAFLPKKVNEYLSLIMQAIGVVVIIFFAYQGIVWIMRPEVRTELAPTTQLPVWFNYAFLPGAFCLMSIHQIIGLLVKIAQMRKAG